MTTGVLLLNLGTPDEPTVPAVRRYLAEFLMDPYVVDIPAPLRWALVYGAILPRRPARSAAAYAKIWTQRGSPLLFHSKDLAERVDRKLGDAFTVELGMRYGNPSIASALTSLRARKPDRLVVMPLYPQYSLAATESAIQKVRRTLASLDWEVPVRFVPPFYDHPAFIEAFATVVQPLVEKLRPDYVLFSFHGLPERQVKKTDATGTHCLANAHCCDRITDANRNCYRAQSFATAKKLAESLKLPSSVYGVSFQSRLGRTPWIRPYTDHVYRELAARKVQRLLVVCPAFVADCLETVEEVALRGREDFRQAGGGELYLAPSLNATAPWVEAVASLVRAD